MIINWQDIFYFTASFTMIAVFVTCVWLMWLLFIASKFISKLMTAGHKWNNVVDDIRYFRKNVKLKVLSFLLQILDKGGQNE